MLESMELPTNWENLFIIKRFFKKLGNLCKWHPADIVYFF